MKSHIYQNNNYLLIIYNIMQLNYNILSCIIAFYLYNMMYILVSLGLYIYIRISHYDQDNSYTNYGTRA